MAGKGEAGRKVEAGDEVVYTSPDGKNLVRGLVAEVRPGVLNPKVLKARVVDFWSESKDEEAGHWVNIDRILTTLK